MTKLCRLLCIGLVLATTSLKAAVLVKDKQWDNQTVINVVFLDGPAEVHQKIEQIAPIWLVESGLSFKFFRDYDNSPKDKHIRVSFKSHSGSRLGNHKDYHSPQATMNLKALVDSDLGQRESQRLILHEFGHALGLEHEYRSQYWPYGDKALRQIRERCYPQMESIGYDPASAITHCDQINSQLKGHQVHSTAYDERSIMNYAFSFQQVNGQQKSIPANFKLSLLDKYAIKKWYPQSTHSTESINATESTDSSKATQAAHDSDRAGSAQLAN